MRSISYDLYPMIHTHDPYPFRGCDPYLRSIPMIHTWVTASVGDVLVLFLNCICRILKFVLPHVFWGWGPICLASAYLPRICRLTGGQWKTCAMSLAAWPVGPRIPFQLGLALGRAPLPWAQSSWFTIPYHTIIRSSQAVRETNRQLIFASWSPFRSIHRSIPVPCLNHAMWNSSPHLNDSENLYESYCYI